LLEQIIDKEMKRLPKVSGADQMLSKATIKTLNEANLIAKNSGGDLLLLKIFS